MRDCPELTLGKLELNSDLIRISRKLDWTNPDSIRILIQIHVNAPIIKWLVGVGGIYGCG